MQVTPISPATEANLSKMTKAQLVDHMYWLNAKHEREIARIVESTPVVQEKPSTGIGDFCVGLLAEVAYYEDISKPAGENNIVDADHPNAGSVGWSYDEILLKIKEAFPSAKTKVASLRWYAAKMNNHAKGYEGHTMPRRRPRSG